MSENNKKIETCPYCVNSKEHAKRHGNDDEYVLCLPHRILHAICSNSYTEGSVDYRNPETHGAYKRLIKEIIPDNMKSIPRDILGEDLIISMGIPYLMEAYKKGIFYPCVLANISLENEYVNRRLAIIFEIDEAWGILENDVLFFFRYIGFQALGEYHSINTNTNGKAIEIGKDLEILSFFLTDKNVTLFKQRKECEECKLMNQN